MIGDLSLRPAPEPARNMARDSGSQLPGPAPDSPKPPDAGGVEPEIAEARRLKALLTDPSVKVRTHHDESSGRVVLTVQDQTTGRLVEQFPSDKMLRLYATLRESLIDEQI